MKERNDISVDISWKEFNMQDSFCRKLTKTLQICEVTLKSHSYKNVRTRMKFDLHQGVRFDPDLPQTIRLEFAKSNTKVSKPKQPSPPAAPTHPGLLHPITGQGLYTSGIPQNKISERTS
ncbi:UNVERIFIED_CONTAM: cpo [Trichonephila clavipes]